MASPSHAPPPLEPSLDDDPDVDMAVQPDPLAQPDTSFGDGAGAGIKQEKFGDEEDKIMTDNLDGSGGGGNGEMGFRREGLGMGRDGLGEGVTREGLEGRVPVKKDISLREFLGRMDEFAPIVSWTWFPLTCLMRLGYRAGEDTERWSKILLGRHSYVPTNVAIFSLLIHPNPLPNPYSPSTPLLLPPPPPPSPRPRPPHHSPH